MLIMNWIWFYLLQQWQFISFSFLAVWRSGTQLMHSFVKFLYELILIEMKYAKLLNQNRMLTQQLRVQCLKETNFDEIYKSHDDYM